MSLSIRLFGNRDRAQELVGKAKKQMVALKHFMGFGNISQLEPQPIRMSDGSTIRVRSIFGIDIIDIIGAGVVLVEVGELIPANFLFLITSPTEYAAWNISRGSNGVVTLAPKSIKFPDMEEVASDIQHCDTKTRVPFIYPSTVKSNSDYNRHRFAKANVPIIPGSFGSNSINRYGSYGYYYYKGIWYCFYDGIRSCWQPSNFNLNNVERWVNSWFNGEPDYVCSARHFFQTYFETPESTNPEINEIAIKNLEFWRITDTEGRIEYDTKEGHQIGTTFSGLSVWSDIYGVLSKDKIIFKDPNSNTEDDNQIGTKEYSGTPNTNCCDTVLIGQGFDLHNIQHLGGKFIKFGDVVLDIVDGRYWTDDFTYSTIGAPGICSESTEEMDIQGRVERYMPSKNFQLMDYDNLNGDETFICFYASQADSARFLIYVVDVRNVAYYHIFTKNTGTVREFRMAYRTNAGVLVNTLIATLVDGINETRSNSSPCAYYDTTTISGFSGIRISDVSCQVTPKYILYSYVKQTYSGPLAEAHFNDDDNVLWDFNSRTLGIIDIETGKKNEYIVDDDLLGKKYKDTFDKTKAAAIGLHKEGG